MLSQPAPARKRQDEGLVESAGMADVDVTSMQALGWRSFAASQSVGHAPVVAHGCYAVDEQADDADSNESASQSVEWSCSVSAVAMPRHLSWWRSLDDGMDHRHR